MESSEDLPCGLLGPVPQPGDVPDYPDDPSDDASGNASEDQCGCGGNCYRTVDLYFNPFSGNTNNMGYFDGVRPGCDCRCSVFGTTGTGLRLTRSAFNDLRPEICRYRLAKAESDLGQYFRGPAPISEGGVCGYSGDASKIVGPEDAAGLGDACDEIGVVAWKNIDIETECKDDGTVDITVTMQYSEAKLVFRKEGVTFADMAAGLINVNIDQESGMPSEWGDCEASSGVSNNYHVSLDFTDSKCDTPADKITNRSYGVSNTSTYHTGAGRYALDIFPMDNDGAAMHIDASSGTGMGVYVPLKDSSFTCDESLDSGFDIKSTVSAVEQTDAGIFVCIKHECIRTESQSSSSFSSASLSSSEEASGLLSSSASACDISCCLNIDALVNVSGIVYTNDTCAYCESLGIGLGSTYNMCRNDCEAIVPGTGGLSGCHYMLDSGFEALQDCEDEAASSTPVTFDVFIYCDNDGNTKIKAGLGYSGGLFGYGDTWEGDFVLGGTSTLR